MFVLSLSPGRYMPTLKLLYGRFLASLIHWKVWNTHIACTLHLVPLFRQALTILEKIKNLNGGCELIFVGEHVSRKPMSESTLNKAPRVTGWSNDGTGQFLLATTQEPSVVSIRLLPLPSLLLLLYIERSFGDGKLAAELYDLSFVC